MRTRRSNSSAIICAVFFVALALLQTSADAQSGTKSAPVTVTNTTANPVPVTGGVAITNTPSVDARQSGTWNVGIAGRPTVGIDPGQNTVTATSGASVLVLSRIFSFPFSSHGVDLVIESSKARVCANNTGNNNAIDVDINAVIPPLGEQAGFLIRMDNFTVPAGGFVCKVYEVMPIVTSIDIFNQNVNTTGQVKLAIFRQ